MTLSILIGQWGPPTRWDYAQGENKLTFQYFSIFPLTCHKFKIKDFFPHKIICNLTQTKHKRRCFPKVSQQILFFTSIYFSTDRAKNAFGHCQPNNIPSVALKMLTVKPHNAVETILGSQTIKMKVTQKTYPRSILYNPRCFLMICHRFWPDSEIGTF